MNNKKFKLVLNYEFNPDEKVSDDNSPYNIHYDGLDRKFGIRWIISRLVTDYINSKKYHTDQQGNIDFESVARRMVPGYCDAAGYNQSMDMLLSLTAELSDSELRMSGMYSCMQQAVVKNNPSFELRQPKDMNKKINLCRTRFIKLTKEIQKMVNKYYYKQTKKTAAAAV